MTEKFEIRISPYQAQSEASLLPRLSAPGFLDRRHSSFSSPPLQAWPLFLLSLSFLSLVSSASLSGPSALACCGEQRHPWRAEEHKGFHLKLKDGWSCAFITELLNVTRGIDRTAMLTFSAAPESPPVKKSVLRRRKLKNVFTNCWQKIGQE